jgi:glycosyltransferase involved in cell wall biosynthesis
MSEEAVPALQNLGVKPEQMDLILPAVCWNQFAQVRANPGRVVSRPTVIYTGNPDGYQNLDLLLRAMRLVVKQLPAARLLVVTGSKPRGVLEQGHQLGLSDSNLSIVVTREWRQVQEAMAEAQVAALPRESCRGFPVKLLNYQAMGLPVVACAGSAKTIEHGRSGLVVTDGDERGFAVSLLELLSNPGARDRMGSSGRTAVQERHCWKSRVIELEQTYARVIGLESRRGLL